MSFARFLGRVLTGFLLTAALFAATSSAQTAGEAGDIRTSADGKARQTELGGGVDGERPMTPVAAKGAVTDCVDGQAAGFPCHLIDLVSFLPREHLGAGSGIRLNDIWGWTDPVTGREWAIVGRMDGVSFVDISEPANPRFAGNLPLHQGSSPQTWRDFKVFDDHLFVVADGLGSQAHGMQVFDLTRLRLATGTPVVFTEDAQYGGIGAAHNIAINEASGYAYIVGAGFSDVCGTALHMVDISQPTAPVHAGCFRDQISRTGYVHDVQCVDYHGPDQRYAGREICIGSNVDAVVVADVTDKQNPVMVGAGQYPLSGYIHQGWLTDDHRYFVQDDELDERAYEHGARTRIWDVTQLDDPQLAATYTSPLTSIDHNLYTSGDLVFLSNYTSGLRVLDISDVNRPTETAWFDTYPANDETNFNGAWSSYPYFESGNVIVSSRDEGLFVLRLQDVARVSLRQIRVDVTTSQPEEGAGGHEALVSFSVSHPEVLADIEVSEADPGGATADLLGSPGPGQSEYQARLTDLSVGAHEVGITAVGKDGSRAEIGSASFVVIPDTHILTEPAPNPTATGASLSLMVRERQPVKASLYDVSGRVVMSVLDDWVDEATEIALSIDPSSADLSAGLYILQVEGRFFSDTRTLVVVN